MLYSILIYGNKDEVAAWPPEVERELMARHTALREDLIAAGRLGPVLRLKVDQLKTVRGSGYADRKFITDGPYAETKEQLLGLYVVECSTFEDAVAVSERLRFAGCVFEIAPLTWSSPGVAAPLTPGECHG